MQKWLLRGRERGAVDVGQRIREGNVGEGEYNQRSLDTCIHLSKMTKNIEYRTVTYIHVS